MSFDYDTFFDQMITEGKSIDDIMSSFTDAANRAIMKQKEAEAAAKAAAEEAEKAKRLKIEKREEFINLLDSLTDFALSWDYITDEEYDAFWDDMTDETADKLLAELERTIHTIQRFNRAFGADSEIIKDLKNIFEESGIDPEENKNAAIQPTPVDKEPASTRTLFKVKVPGASEFATILNKFLGL